MKVTHGMSGTRVHNIWMGIHYRCRHDKSGNYGDRGISVCDRWNCFDNFLEDMGTPPSDNHSIDRIDVNGDYEPSNCRWATDKQQARNARSNTLIEFNGKTKTLAGWAEEKGIKQPTLCVRIYKLGWPIKKALTKPVNPTGISNQKKKEIYQDWLKTKGSYRAIGRRHNVSHHTVKRAIKKFSIKDIKG